MKKVLVVMFLLMCASVWAMTPQQKFNAQVNKALPPSESFANGGPLSKYICVCNDPTTPTLFLMAGVLEVANGIVGCSIYFFNPDGSISGIGACTSWLPVAR